MDVRVGDYTFDSSLFVTQDRRRGGGVPARPRRSTTTTTPCGGEIWLATDAAYKRAVSVFAKKKAAFQNRAGADQPPRFLTRNAGRDGAAAPRRRRSIAALDRSRRSSCRRFSLETRRIESSDVWVVRDARHAATI